MNLLKDEWIPVRPLPNGSPVKISLRHLLCGEEKWEVCLPRDDMELAAIQLLVCITQTLFIPKTASELKQRIAKPLSETEYDVVIAPYDDWFRLDHPKYPFMQVRGVAAKKVTPMDKLLAGLSGAENCCFVNESDLAAHLCGGCTTIALFNQASCAPSFGGGNEGGFKPGLRGSSPITTLLQGAHLRQTVWLNILYEGQLDQRISWHSKAKSQKPTWVVPIKKAKNIHVEQIGLIRGLLWQPAHIELIHQEKAIECSCCGNVAGRIYSGFLKEQFGFNVLGTWPHPHSPRVIFRNKSEIDEKFVTFRGGTPSWTQLSRFVIRRKFRDNDTEGQQPSAVVIQARQMYGGKSEYLHLLIGGYRTSKASVLERQYDVVTLNHGWERNIITIDQLVQLALGYRDAIYKALYIFVHGIPAKDNGGEILKGALRGKDKEKEGLRIFFRKADEAAPKDKKCRLYLVVEKQFFRQSEPMVQDTLARIDFNDSAPVLADMQESLKRLVKNLFNESVRPYLQDPELIKTMAVARRTLNKHLRNLEPQQDKGGNDGTAAA